MCLFFFTDVMEDYVARRICGIIFAMHKQKRDKAADDNHHFLPVFDNDHDNIQCEGHG